MPRLLVRTIGSLLILGLCLPPAMGFRAPVAHAATTASFSSIPAVQEQTTTIDSLSQIIDQIATIKKVIDKLQRQLDQSQINLDDLAMTLGNEADALIDWVRTEIAFEQYPGLLRGSRGTLIGRAGNTLDTAFLLAHLLADAGYEVRIARGNLPTATARTLVDQMMASRPDATAVGDEAKLRALLVELGQAFGLSASESKAQVEAALATADTPDPRFADAQQDADFILATLDEAGVDLGNAAAIDQLVAEATDYFWVQYRLVAGQPWQAAHPAFKDITAAPKKLKASATFFENVPPELLHRIRIEVTIEQKVDDQLTTAVIMPPWEQPVAALVGQPLVYRNNPVSLQNLQELLDVEAFLAKPLTFVPSFNNELVLDGLGFDLNGNSYDVGLSGDALGLTQIGQSLGNALEEATGALNGDSENATEVASDLITLTGEWIDYTLIAPGGVERTFRRTILDRISAEDRSAGIVRIAPGAELPAAAAPLLTQHSILVLPGLYSRNYVAQRFLSQLKAQIDLVDYLRKQMPFGDQPVAPPLKLLLANTPFDDVVLNQLFARNPLTSNAADNPLISYRSEPYLVILEDGLLLNRAQPTGFLRVDVINNTRRTFAVQNGSLTPATEANVLAGAWETHAEQSPFANIQGRRFSTLTAFISAAQAGVPTAVITPADPALLDSQELPAISRQAIARDLANGYVVIVPEVIASGDGAAGWWRVNPQTGETLGLAGDGRGNSTVEYSFLAALKENLILGAPSTLAGYGICMAGPSGRAGCCAADAALAYGAGAGLGAVVAYKSASAAILLGEALKFGGLFGGATGATPSFCN